MLATSDDADGLPGHVSGFTQFTIFIFMFGVQIAVTVQEAIFHGISGYSETVHVERYLVKECMFHSSSNEQYPVIQRMWYATLLLILQICINPFIVKSERNYREGILFCFASTFVLIIWIIWITMYIVMGERIGNHWHDKSVVCGLLASSIMLIITIFVPKVSFDHKYIV